MSDEGSQLNAAFVMPAEILAEVYGPEGVAEVGRMGRLVHPPLDREDLMANAHPWTKIVDVLFTSWGAPVMDAAMLRRFPKLKIVFYGAGSSRSLVTPDFWERNIFLTTAAAANAVPVAEYTLAATLLGLKQAWSSARRTQSGQTFSRRPFEPEGAYGARVGLVSLGLIGRLVRERLGAFDVEVVAYDPFLTSREFAELSIEPLSLAELFATSSVVSLHTPALPETVGLITGKLVASMKKNATLINTARGALINEGELCAVLRERPDLQVVLDVTYPEPPSPDSALYQLPNIFLTPHIAGSRGRERRRLGESMIAEFDRFSRGEALQHTVSATQASQMA